MSSAPRTSTYGAGAATLSVVCSRHAFFGSMVGLICPGLDPANAGTLKPVGWKSVVYVKKRKKAAVYKTRPIIPWAGATGDAGGAAGGKARSTEAQTNMRGSNISLGPSSRVKIPEKGS